MEEVIIAWHGRVGVTVSESLFVCFLAPECFPEFFSTKLSPADKLYTYRWKAGEFIVPMIYSQFILETKKEGS